MAARPKWLEDALEEFGTQIVEEELDDAEVAELTGFTPRKVRLLMKEVAELSSLDEDEDEEEDEDSDDESEEEESEDEDEEEEEEEEPAPRRGRGSKAKAKPEPEPEDDDEDDEDEPAPRRGKSKASKAAAGPVAKGKKAAKVEEPEDDEDEDEEEEEAPKKRGRKAKPVELPEDLQERIIVAYKTTLAGNEDLTEELNEAAQARLDEVVEMDFSGILERVEVFNVGAKWADVRLFITPESLPKGKKSDEKKRETLVKQFIKDLRGALEESDGQAKIYKRNTQIFDDGNGSMDIQLRIR